MARRLELQGNDLARPAKELPLKTIKALGYLLHSHLHNSGNWETVAEDLGYCYEAIKQFSTSASVRQDCTPGELMLRDWIGRGPGRTLFVLRNALNSSDRTDCVDFLDQEINDKVLHMDLHVCLADPNGSNVNYQPIRTKSDASLRDSLQNFLDGPIRNYQLADSGASWDSTIAREYKGQELRIYRLNPVTVVIQEQDPTIDSSSQSFDNNIEMQDPQSNGLNRVTQRQPAATQHLNLNIPADKHSNFPKVEPKSSLSYSCQVSTQTTPTVVKRSITIYDDQDLTLQDIRLRSRHTGTTKLDTNSLLDSNLTTMSIEQSNCVTSSNDMVVNQGCRGSNTFIKEPNYCSANLSKVVFGRSHLNSDTFQKVPYYAPSSSEAALGQSFSINMDSLTAQKQIASQEYAERNMNLRDNFASDSNEHVMDSITEQKEIFKCSRSTENLVDYTPSSSGSFSDKCSFSDSLNQENCTVDENSFSTTATAADDYPLYSFARYQEEAESHVVNKEKFLYDSKAVEADSSMDTQVVGDQLGDNGIRFVNTDMEMNETEYQAFQDDKYKAVTGVRSEKYRKIDKFPSEMDYQPVSDRSICLHYQLGNKVHKVNASKTVNLESSEIDDPAYTEQWEIDNAKFILGNNAFNADIANLVDDSAICVVDNVETTHFDDLVDDSAICVVKNEVVYDSDTRVNVNEEFKSEDIADFVDDSAIHVADNNDNNTQCLMDNSPAQSSRRLESSGVIDIYASSVIAGIEENETERPSPNSKQQRGQGSSYPYEKLQRFVSCPSELGYEAPNKEMRFQNVLKEMPTIADSFTPVREELELNDFLKRGKVQWSKPGGNTVPIVNSLDRGKKNRTVVQVDNTPNRHSYTGVHRCNDIRRELHHTNTRSLENRPLPAPPVGDLGNQCQGHSRKSPPLLPPKASKFCQHPYKLVTGGKSSRPMLDQLLANDRLFIHYNNCLQGYPGWSPRETEYTVEKTLHSVKRSNGYYLLWYIRGRKRLALSISHMGKILHYEVRTKVSDGQLYYYIFPDTVYSDVRLLLQYHESHGLLPQTEQVDQTGSTASCNGRDGRQMLATFKVGHVTRCLACRQLCHKE